MDAPHPTRHRSTYSWRAKLGLIVPSTNTVNEPEWARLLPDGVTAHTVRMALHVNTESEEGRRRLDTDLDIAMAALAQARVDVIAYACTAGSMTLPAEALPESMAARAGTPCVTTAAAIVAALRRLGTARIAVATPYHDGLNAHEAHFLAASGIEALSVRGLGIGAGGLHEFVRIAETPMAAVGAHARAAMATGAEALLISCTDFPTLPLIPVLEAELGVPVISSNTATLWAALRAAGIADPMPGAGKLLAEP